MPEETPPTVPYSTRLASRADLTSYLAGLCAELGVEYYMLIAVVHDRDRHDARIVASNWVYDAIQLLGSRQLASIVLGSVTVMPGQAARPVVTAQAPDLGDAMDGATAKLLQLLGHAELHALKLYVGRHRYFLMLSNGEDRQIDTDAVSGAHLRICYALSQAPELISAASLADPLTDRERECMFWVSEGKTTDDIAAILSVSANTANSYIANAIQKLSASNRAMAMATAIRSGII